MVEKVLERGLFASRWLMAPMYVGLVGALLVLMLKFGQGLYEFALHFWGATEAQTVLAILSLIDMTLAGNLLLIVIFSGYENFVSRIDVAGVPIAKVRSREFPDPKAG